MVTRKVLLGLKIDEIVVVCPDFKGFRVSFQVVAEGFKGVNNGKEFFIVDVIILFSWEE